MAFRKFEGGKVDESEGWRQVEVQDIGMVWARIVPADGEYKRLVDDWYLFILGWGRPPGYLLGDLPKKAQATLMEAYNERARTVAATAPRGA